MEKMNNSNEKGSENNKINQIQKFRNHEIKKIIDNNQENNEVLKW